MVKMGIPRSAYRQLLDKQYIPIYSKYHNKPTFVDNIRFASKGEAGRYQILKQKQQSGIIKDLRLQPSYKFPMGFSYRADFEYMEGNDMIVEDFKGVETDVFKLKAKCLTYFYPHLKLRIVKK